MQVRIVKETELWNVLNFSAQMFWQQDLGRYTEEGKNHFLEFLKYERQLEKFRAGEILLFAAFDQEKICGAMELDTKGSILFLYTNSIKRVEQIAGTMIYEACRLAKSSGMYETLNIAVLPEKEPVYRQLGFVPGGEYTWEDGVQKCPLWLSVEAKLVKGAPKKETNTWVYIAIGAGAVVFIIVLLFSLLVSLFIKLPPKTWEEYSIEEQIPDDAWENEDEWYDGLDEWENPEDYDDTEDTKEGILSLDSYIAPDAGYETEEKNEKFQSDDYGAYFIAYDITYPELTGLPENVQSKINEELKKCAMETIDKYYENPSEEIKEWMLMQPQAIVVSQVNYIVSYMDENLMSVAFEDSYIAGNYNASYIGLRSVLVNVKDGTVYKIGDVLNLNQNFVKNWQAAIESSYPNNEFASAYGTAELEAMFQGKYEADGIRPAIILTEDGIEIGFEYRIPGEDGVDRTGYITALYQKADLRRYYKSVKFWKMVKNN